MNKLGKYIINDAKDRARRTILDPINQLVDDQLTDISTSIGAFVIRAVRGKWQRSITFTVTEGYGNAWLETALYDILYQYNNIRSKSRLELNYRVSPATGNTIMYCQLGDGTHNLKYRDWDILLNIQTTGSNMINGRTRTVRIYTIICYDLSPKFVRAFEKDMLARKNKIFNIDRVGSSVNLYVDLHEQDGYTYWEKRQSIPKRTLESIYLPEKQKMQLINTIDNWFANKALYEKQGIPWNLKILLYGPSGSGKSSIVKFVASHWHRNLYEITGGKGGKFIPNAIGSTAECVVDPLFSISDMDKYPALCNEPDGSMNADSTKDEHLLWKQAFNNMINTLDGITCGTGKIIMITTNHIEKFSPTFLRPGRIDLLMEIGYVTPEVFIDYVRSIYGIDLPKDIKLKRDDLTISDMQPDVLFYKLDPEEFVNKYVSAP